MSAETRVTTGTQAVAARRRAAAARVWREFVATRSGLVGLLLLVAVITIALLAPVLVPAATLDVTQVTAAANQPPMAGYPLGTDAQGRSVLGMLVWGARISLLVGFAATAVSMVIGTAMGMAAGHFGGAGRAVIMRVIDDHRRDRRHQLGRHGARGPRPDADHRVPAVHRARPGARRR